MRLSQRRLHDINQHGFGDFIWSTCLIKGFLRNQVSHLFTKFTDASHQIRRQCLHFYLWTDWWLFYYFSRSNLVNELINRTLLYHKASTVTTSSHRGSHMTSSCIFSNNNSENYLPVNSTDKAATVTDPTSRIKVLNYPLKKHLLPSLCYTPAVSRTPFKQVFPPSSPWTVWSGYPASASRFV